LAGKNVLFHGLKEHASGDFAPTLCYLRLVFLALRKVIQKSATTLRVEAHAELLAEELKAGKLAILLLSALNLVAAPGQARQQRRPFVV